MKRELVSCITLGKQVKLTPQGKLYTVHTADRNKVYLQEVNNPKAELKEVSFQTSVYVVE